MNIMRGGIMNSQSQSAAWLSGPTTVAAFADLPAASSQPNAMFRVGDLNNAVLISDGANWGPLNGQAVLANAHNVNLTIQSLTETLITSVAFPAGFVRAGSRFRLWVRQKFPAIGSVFRAMRFRAGAVGGGVAGSLIGFGAATTDSPDSNGRMCVELTALGTVGQHIGSASQNSVGGLYTTYVNNIPMTTVDFTAPWEIAFTGISAAETAQTGVTATWAAGVATFTSTAHGYAVGDKIVNTTFAPAGYNGTLIVTGVTANTWTSAIAADPGGAGTGGTTSRVSNVTLVDYLIEWLQ